MLTDATGTERHPFPVEWGARQDQHALLHGQLEGAVLLMWSLEIVGADDRIKKARLIMIIRWARARGRVVVGGSGGQFYPRYVTCSSLSNP